MNRARIGLLSFAVFLFSMSVRSQEDANAKPEDVKAALIAMEKKYAELCRKQDFDGLTKLMTDDYLDISESGIRTIKQIIDELKALGKDGAQAQDAFEVKNPRIMEISPQAAVIIYEQDGLSFSGLWVKVGAAWKCRLTHVVSKAKPGGPDGPGVNPGQEPHPEAPAKEKPKDK